MSEEISPLENHSWWMEQLRKNAKANQPEALRLADRIETQALTFRDKAEAAAELRRLHAVNQELLEAAKLALSIIWFSKEHDAISAAIAKAEGEV